jgi:hypothetical protein
LEDDFQARLEDPRKEPRAPNPNILGPIFTPKAIFGRFWLSVLGGFSIPLLGSFLTINLVVFLTSILTPFFRKCRLTLNAVLA